MIYRKSIKIPLSRSCKIPIYIRHEYDFYYRFDIFYKKDWKNKKKKPVILHLTGAGMRSPYTVESSMVKKWIEEGFIFCCVYYYHYYFKDLTWNKQDKKTSRLSDPPYTQKPYWCENFSFGQDYHHHLRMRAYMIQSTLEYIVDHHREYKFTKFDINNIFFTTKSRGGASAIVWSALSNCKEWKKYQKFCKGIVNSNGFVGSGNLLNKTSGWRNFKNTVQVLSYYLANTQHTIYHVYNEKDVGNNDLARRLMLCIPQSKHAQHYFTNFTDLGHVTNLSYNICVVQSLMSQKRCYMNKKPILNLCEIFEQFK